MRLETENIHDFRARATAGFPPPGGSWIVVQQLLQNTELKDDIAYISANFAFLVSCIEQLERNGVSVHGSLEIIEDVKTKLSIVRGQTADLLEINSEPSLTTILDTAL